MLVIKLIPFIFQALILFVDEHFCHKQRTLRRWERLGHPLDSISFASGLIWLLCVEPSPVTRVVYVVLAILSCLFVSKDEWEHHELSSGFENWLHALLFMLHPVLLIWAGWLWWTGDAAAKPVIVIATAGSLSYAIYQYLYWNMWRHDRQ